MKKNKVLQKQEGGNHYKEKKIQPWEIIEEYNLDFWEGNILKYLLRQKDNRLLDLKKIIHYTEYCIYKLNLNDKEEKKKN